MKKSTKKQLDQLNRILNSRTLAESVRGILYFFGRMVSHPAGLAVFLAGLGVAYENIFPPSQESMRYYSDEFRHGTPEQRKERAAVAKQRQQELLNWIHNYLTFP